MLPLNALRVLKVGCQRSRVCELDLPPCVICPGLQYNWRLGSGRPSWQHHCQHQYCIHQRRFGFVDTCLVVLSSFFCQFCWGKRMVAPFFVHSLTKSLSFSLSLSLPPSHQKHASHIGVEVFFVFMFVLDIRIRIPIISVPALSSPHAYALSRPCPLAAVHLDMQHA